MPQAQRFEVTREEDGVRLDRFLADKLALSRSQVRRLLAGGKVRLAERSGNASSKGLALCAGEVVEVEPFTAPEDQEAAPEPGLVVPVLAEGPGWVALDKPAGMPVHPLREHERGTALNALRAMHPEIHGVGEGGLRSGVVHRLDVDTSGALLFATRRETWERLRAAFRERRVSKRYAAVVQGSLAEGEEDEIELPLYVTSSRPARVRMARAGERGVATHTRWQVVRAGPGWSRLAVEIETGFLHQIRATLTHVGHPILGDALYAPAPVARRAPRQLLHSERVAFEELEAQSPLPEDFEPYR